jgi:hypothetical protein
MVKIDRFSKRAISYGGHNASPLNPQAIPQKSFFSRKLHSHPPPAGKGQEESWLAHSVSDCLRLRIPPLPTVLLFARAYGSREPETGFRAETSSLAPREAPGPRLLFAYSELVTLSRLPRFRSIVGAIPGGVSYVYILLPNGFRPILRAQETL